MSGKSRRLAGVGAHTGLVSANGPPSPGASAGRATVEETAPASRKRSGAGQPVPLSEDTVLKNPLDSLTGTIIAGFVLTVILYFAVKAMSRWGHRRWTSSPFARWFHYLGGVMWIGLLYYFNFVQVQSLAEANNAADGSAAGITKFVAPRALQIFRWAAAVTWVDGRPAARRLRRLRRGVHVAAAVHSDRRRRVARARSCCSTSG